MRDFFIKFRNSFHSLNKSIYGRHVSRTILMVIDAMRTDFIQNQQNTSMKYVNRMINDGSACMLNLNVEVPTVTMPRIKVINYFRFCFGFERLLILALSFNGTGNDNWWVLFIFFLFRFISSVLRIKNYSNIRKNAYINLFYATIFIRNDTELYRCCLELG